MYSFFFCTYLLLSLFQPNAIVSLVTSKGGKNQTLNVQNSEFTVCGISNCIKFSLTVRRSIDVTPIAVTPGLSLAKNAVWEGGVLYIMHYYMFLVVDAVQI